MFYGFSMKYRHLLAMGNGQWAMGNGRGEQAIAIRDRIIFYAVTGSLVTAFLCGPACKATWPTGQPLTPSVQSSTGVSLATLNASHFTPWREKFTCARASAPAPSMDSTLPSPNLL